MHKANDCTKCKKKTVCSKIEDYNTNCVNLEDTNNTYYVSKLHCKHFESETV